jgi:septum formation topological specificity factor MinE
MSSTGLLINVIITDPNNTEIEETIDLELVHIRDRTADVPQFVAGLKTAIVQFVTKYGDVDEF